VLVVHRCGLDTSWRGTSLVVGEYIMAGNTSLWIGGTVHYHRWNSTPNYTDTGLRYLVNRINHFTYITLYGVHFWVG
jgi:hypothetical protein